MIGNFLLISFSCQPLNTQTQVIAEIKLATASNLLVPIEELADAFTQQTGIAVKISAGASGALSGQINQGAPFDYFLCANESYAAYLNEKGLSLGPPQILVMGRLAFWAKDSVNVKAQQVFKDFRNIAIADPELAPYGKLAINYLQSRSDWEEIQPKLLYGLSIGQVNQYIYTDLVDAAFTARSAKHISEVEEYGHWTEDLDLPPIPHCGLLLKDRPEIHSWHAFLKGPTGQRIFEKYGYLSHVSLQE